MLTLPLFLGLTLGIRHAADADHVATIAAVVIGRTNLSGALRTAIMWGLGHSLTFFAVGLGIVLFNLQLPESFDAMVEILIGLSLLFLGGHQLWRCYKLPSSLAKPDSHTHSHPSRSLMLGSMHGLAGSATVALIALSTIGSRPAALLYLGLFGVGTMVGMAIITLILAYSFRLSSSSAAAQRALIGLAGLASCVCGLLLFSEVLLG